MSTQHTPGPWQVAMLERPQMRPYYVVRQIGERHWDQLREGGGTVARFETGEEARAAIAKATGSTQ